MSNIEWYEKSIRNTLKEIRELCHELYGAYPHIRVDCLEQDTSYNLPTYKVRCFIKEYGDKHEGLVLEQTYPDLFSVFKLLLLELTFIKESKKSETKL